MADAGLTGHGLKILRKHFDELIDAITDPDALAEEACEVELIHPECKRTLQSYRVDAKTKARFLLLSIEGKIEDQPVYCQGFLTLLKKLPGLANFGITLQKTYVLDEMPKLHQLQRLYKDDVVVNIIRAVAPSWEKFALYLTMDSNMIDIWKRDAYQVEDAAMKLFDHWLKGNGCQPISWKTLIQALHENDLPNVAIKVEEILTGHSVVREKRPLEKLAEEPAEKRPRLEGEYSKTSDIDSHSANVAIDNNPVVHEKRPLEKLAEEAVEKRPRLEGELLEHSETNDIDSHSANVAIDSNQVVREKRPLEKSAEEEPAEKHPRLEGEYSEISDIDSHSANVAIDNNPLLKHRPNLAAFYRHQPEVPIDTWPPVKKTQYINLALIETEKPADFNKELLRQTIRGSIDDIMKDKDDIKYDEVFTEVKEGTTLLFEGRPGCGKTTMMNKVSQDWAKGKIFSSCLLFLILLRRFGNRLDIDLESVLRSTPVEFSDEEIQELTSQIKSNQGKGVVFALDGLDEYCPERNSKEFKTTFIHKLIKKEVLPESIVIVSSRPAASQKYRRGATNCIEVLGFLKQQIDDYINSYFDENKNKDSLVEKLQTYLKNHPNVMHMCYLPLHMAMVACLYEDGASLPQTASLYEDEEAFLPQTETEIYCRFTLSTLQRSIRKRDEIDDGEEFCLSSFDDLQPDDRSVFDSVLELAYEATVVNPQQVFSAKEVKKVTSRRSNDTANSDNFLGLVVVNKYHVWQGLKKIYTFLHLTFQEFLSACHIVQLNSQAQEEAILKYGGNENLGVVWKFYCGMTQFSDENRHNFEQLVEKTKSEVLLHLHCAHESQQNVICTHTINSYGSKIVLNSSSLNPADFTALGYVLTHSSVPATELAIASCNIGPEGLSALEKAVNPSLALKTLSFHGTKIKKMIPELCSVVKKFPQLNNINFSSCGMINKSLSEMVEILPALESVEQLDLSHNELGIKSVETLSRLLTKLPKLKNLAWIDHLLTLSLFDALIKRDVEINLVNKRYKSPMQRLSFEDFDINSVSSYFQAHPCSAVFVQKVILRDKGMDDTDAQSLAKCLPHCINLQQLNLRRNNISDAGAQALAEGLQHCSNLQMLDLMDNKIGNTGAQALAECLQHCTNLKELFLYRNNFDGAGIQALAEHLPHCTNPQNLNLRDKRIGHAGAQTLATSLQYYTDIRTLDLKRNNIGPAGAQALAEGLQHCCHLQELNLYENKIEDAGAQALAEGLRHCIHLQKLNVRYNGIGEIGAQDLAKGLQHCTNLQELDLIVNNIGPAGAQALAEGLQHCTNLQKLYLYGNNIEDPGGQALAEGLQHCTDLQELDLRNNKLTDSSVGSLSQLIRTAKRLNKLDLWDNYRFTDDGRRALKAAAEERNSNLDFAKLGIGI